MSLPGHKALYAEFCRNNYLPLHLQPWWMDAVCGEASWDVCIATDRGGRVTGVLPYYLTKRWGLRVIQQPSLTTYSGPWFCYPDDAAMKGTTRYTFEKKTCTALIAQLPKVAFFQQNLLPAMDNWLPFYWSGFRQTTRYTYIFEDTSDLPTLRKGLKSNLRTNIRKAEKAVVIRDGTAAEIFALYSASLQRRFMPTPCSLQTFERLHDALAKRNNCKIFLAALPEPGMPVAGVYLAFDERRASVLLTGIYAEHRSLYANLYLLEQALYFCHAHGLSLDFEGSMHPDIEHAFRGFGARLTPYHQIWKAGNKLLELLYVWRK